jgi:branched-chain amino acid transport system permease protein
MAEGLRYRQDRLAGDGMSQFLQATIYGLLQGSLFALVACGFSLVWGVMNIINIAHGSFVVLGAYVAWELNSRFGLDPFLGMFVSALVLFVLGYALQRGVINLIVNAPVYITLLLTFGIELLVVNALILGYSGDYRSIPTSYASNGLVIGSVHVPLGRLLAAGVAVAMTGLLVLLVSRTRAGLAIMATGMDRGAARLMGIGVRHVYALTFGISAALAGIAGAMEGLVSTFSPASAGTFTVFSFVVAVLGGLGNMYGALVGGLVLGLAEAWGGQYLPGTLVNAIAFAVLIVALVVRPSGLVGKATFAARVEV